MKKYGILFSIFLFVWAFASDLQAQDRQKIDARKIEITGITLSAKATRILAGWPNEVCSVDQRGRLRPAKGYVIQLDTRRKKVFLTTDKNKREMLPMDGDKDLGNGMTFRCKGACSNCKPDDGSGGFCPGCHPESRESCEGILIMPLTEVAEFETADGNFRAGDLRLQ